LIEIEIHVKFEKLGRGEKVGDKTGKPKDVAATSSIRSFLIVNALALTSYTDKL
jgi:hypothetical protein